MSLLTVTSSLTSNLHLLDPVFSPLLQLVSVPLFPSETSKHPFFHCMSHTPTSNTPGNASGAAAKPTLTGVRIRQRKGQAKATAKFEPEG